MECKAAMPSPFLDFVFRGASSLANGLLRSSGSSCLGDLWPDIQNSPFCIAPERAVELAEIIRSTGITLEFDENEHQDTSFTVNTSSKKIRVGARALGALWLHCHVAWLLFERVVKDGYGTKVDFMTDRDFQFPTTLLALSVSSSQTFTLTGADYNRLNWCARKKSNELFLAATGWCLLHEIGHLVLGHGDPSGLLPIERIRQETEADDWASNWVLQGWREFGSNPMIFGKRSSGISIALLHFASHEVYDRQSGGGTHPDPPDRLDHFITKHLEPEGTSDLVLEEDLPRHFAVCTLKLYFDHKGIELPTNEWSTATDCLNDMLLALKRHATL